MPQPVPIVHVTRGPLTESIHYGHIAVTDISGQVLYECGHPQHITFARSTAKLLQVIPIIESGAADHYRLTPAEIAVMCASHNGEAEHVQTVRSILSKLNLEPSALLCGIHEPWHHETRHKMREQQIESQQMHNNCSGKHAAMLTLGAYFGSPLTAYNSPDHPVQVRILQTFCEFAQLRVDEVPLGVDGCGVPVYGLEIAKLAAAFARLGDARLMTAGRSAACQRVIKALSDHPFLLGGSNRFDTELIRATSGRIIGKMGAEGMYAITIPEAGLGIAIKVADGTSRAHAPAAVEVLRQLNLLSHTELEHLASFHRPPITNRRGEIVGMTEPVLSLHRS